MGAAPLAIELVVILVLTALLLHKYGNWRQQHPIVTVSALISWFFSFIIVCILPLDVSLAFYRHCVHQLEPGNSTAPLPIEEEITFLENSTYARLCHQPVSYIRPYVLPGLWRVVYWTTFVLTWFILPIMQSYSRSGEFTVVGKLRTSLWENAIYYGSFLLLAIVLLIYVAASGFSITPENLKIICISASNTWGLFLLVLLLGYGLVEVPRKLWKSGTKGYSLQKTYFDVDKVASERSDAEDNLRQTLEASKSAVEQLKDHHTLGIYARQILQKFPDDIVQKYSRSRQDRYQREVISGIPDEKSLAALHKKVIESLNSHNRADAQWEELVETALHLEDVARNDQNSNRQFVRSIPDKRPAHVQFVCTPLVEWYWECFIRRPMMKVFSVLLAVLSALIVWSEVTFFSRGTVLSLAALIVDLAGSNNDYAFIELASMVTIAYLAFCAYQTVFKLRIYRYYYLDPHHHTDENSLIFSATLLSRLTPPLCLNFLGLIHLDSSVADDNKAAETAFTAIMGHMQVIWIIAKGFNIYFPILILVLCLGTYFRLGTKFLHLIGIDQFMESDDLTVEMTQAGKALVQAERNGRMREVNRAERQEFWQEKLADHDIKRPLRKGLAGQTQSGRNSEATTPTAGFVPVDFNDSAGIVANADFHQGGSFGGESSSGAEPFGKRYGTTPRRDLFDDL